MATYNGPLETLIYAWAFARVACSIAILVGLGVATRRWWIVAAAMLPTVVRFVPWRLVDSTYHISDVRLYLTIQAACSIVSCIALIALTIVVCREVSPLDAPAPVERGLQLSARALRAFAFATVLVVGAALWVSAARGHSAWLAHAVTEALQLASLCAFAAGGLVAVRGRSELPSWVIMVAAAIVFAVASRLGLVLLWDVQLAIDPGHGPGHAFLLYPIPILGSRSAQLLVALAVGAVLVAIAIGARRRGLEQLHTYVLVRTGMFTVLALGALTVQQLFGEHESLESGAAVLFFASVAATLVAWLVAASTVRRAARELAGEQCLPAAKLIRAAR